MGEVNFRWVWGHRAHRVLHLHSISVGISKSFVVSASLLILTFHQAFKNFQDVQATRSRRKHLRNRLQQKNPFDTLQLRWSHPGRTSSSKLSPTIHTQPLNSSHLLPLLTRKSGVPGLTFNWDSSYTHWDDLVLTEAFSRKPSLPKGRVGVT